MRKRLALAAAVLGASLVLTAGPARAGEPSAAQLSVARKAFAAATELEKEKKWAEAEAKLREALGIKETPGLRYHLGFCLENQQKLVEALVEYDRAEEMLQQGVKAPDVSELLAPAREGVKKRVASVTPKLPAKVEGVVIEVDGRPVKAALLGKPLPQNPGRRVFTASAPGRQPFRKELELAEGESRELVIDLPPKGGEAAAAAGAGAAAPVAAGSGSGKPAGPDSASSGDSSATFDSSNAKPGSARTAVLIGEAAFTVVALGAGIFFAIKADKSQGEVDDANAELKKLGYAGKDACLGDSLTKAAEETCAQLPTLTDQRNRDVNLTRAGFIGAGVGAVATVATFFLWKPASSKTGTRVRVTPVATRDAYGLGLSGRF